MNLALDKKQIARQFSRAAYRYQSVAEVQTLMAQRLLELIPQQALYPQRVIDLGCGSGYLTGQLYKQFPGVDIVALDIAEGMLSACAAGFDKAIEPGISLPSLVRADMESLPFSANCFDLVFSNAAMQWTEVDISLGQIKNILKPGGIAILATFVEGTLNEWRSALLSAGLSATHPMSSMGDLAAIIDNQGFELIFKETKSHKIFYDSVEDLLKSTKQMGATNAQNDRPRGLMGRARYQKLLKNLASEAGGGKCFSSYQAGYFVLRKKP